jgi:hypothetical protein
MSYQTTNPVPFVTLAGVSVPLTKAMILTCGPGTSALYDSLRYKGAAYLVPTGFKLCVVAMKIIANTAAGASALFGSSTASVSNNTIPAGWASQAAGGGNVSVVFTGGTIGNTAECPVYFEAAAGTYAGVQGSNIPMVTVLAYLKAV